MCIRDSVGEAKSDGLIDDAAAQHWKGVIAAGERATALASSLAASRLVACAQVSADGTLAMKTVKAAIAPIDSRVQRDANEAGMAPPAITWTPILGNVPYLEWVSTETKIEDQACDAK